MARISGRNGAMYVDLPGTGTASPVPSLNHYTINFSVDTTDVTCFGDTNKVKVAQLPDASGSYAGFYDTASPQLFSAAVDGVVRATYLYPDRTNVSQYFYGKALFDTSVDVASDGAAAVSGNFSSASAWTKVG